MQNKNGKLSNLNVKCIIRSYEIIQNVKLKDVYYLYCKFKVDNFMRFSWFLYTGHIGARAGMAGNCINGTSAELRADLSLYSIFSIFSIPSACLQLQFHKKLKALLRLIVLGNEVVTKYLLCTRRYQSSHTDHWHWGCKGDNFVYCCVVLCCLYSGVCVPSCIGQMLRCLRAQ